MIAKIYTLALIAGLFLLWGWFSDWSPDQMLFYEGHGSNACMPFLVFTICGHHARLALAFILILVAFITATTSDGRNPRN